MGVAAIRRRDAPPDVVAAERPAFAGLLPIAISVAVAWATLVVLDATGAAATLHHHALIENGPPLWLAIDRKSVV